MKIGIIGNMNNSYFSLTRYLRDEGYDCELLILANEPAHFDPACDTFSDDYKTYCKHVSWGDPGNFLKDDFALVKKDLSPYNFLIGSGPAPAYVDKIGRAIDIFIPYGYDIYSLPFVRIVHPKRFFAYAAVARCQKKGIKESHYIMFDRTNPSSEKIFNKISFNGERIISPPPMVYHKDYENGWQIGAPSNELQKMLENIRQQNDFLLVQHTRQVWKHSEDYLSYKGNHFLVEGYAALVSATPSLKIKLLLFEYGSDVAETKNLINHLGIKDAIIWMPKMPRSQLMRVLAVSDMVIGELHHSWLSYGVAMEAMCLAKPFMHKRIDEEYAGDYAELYPMLHAHSTQSVYAALNELVTKKEKVKAIGEEGRKWFLDYCVQRPLAVLTQIIDQKKARVHA